MKRLLLVALAIATLPACVNLFFAGEQVCFNDLPITDFSWTHPERQDSLRFVSDTMIQLTRPDGSTLDIDVGEAAKVEDATECDDVRPTGFGLRSAEAELPEAGTGPFSLTFTAVPGARFVGLPSGTAVLNLSGGGTVTPSVKVDVAAEPSDDRQEMIIALNLPDLAVDVDSESGVPVRQTLVAAIDWQLELPSGEVVEESRNFSVQSDCNDRDGTCKFDSVYPPPPCL